MRLAYCFFGHLRCYQRNDTLIVNLIERNAHLGEFDVFVHTYRTRNSPAPLWHPDNVGYDVPVTAVDETWIRERYPNVRVFEIDSARGGDEHFAPAYAKVGGRWTASRVTELRQLWCTENGVTHDLVVYPRFDLLLCDPVDLPPDPAPRTIYGGYNRNAERRGLDSDIFVYGRPEVLDAYLVPAIPKDQEELIWGYGFTGERLSTAHRKALGFSHVPQRYKMALLRTNGPMHIDG